MATLEVENFYERIKSDKEPNKDNPNFELHGIKIPFRMLIVGASGSMKTNSAMDIIKKFSDTFDHVTIVTRNIKEPLYTHLTENTPEEQLTIIEVEEDDLSELPKMEELDNEAPPTLLIFDDLVLVKNQKKIVEYFIRCRKYNISVMYLTQSYFNTPKTIRGNANIILFKKINSTNDLRMILSEYSLSVDLPTLMKLHQECTREQKDWLMIRMENQAGDQFFHNYTNLHVGGPGADGEKCDKKNESQLGKRRTMCLDKDDAQKMSKIPPIPFDSFDKKEPLEEEDLSSTESAIDYGTSDSDDSESERYRKKQRERFLSCVIPKKKGTRRK